MLNRSLLLCALAVSSALAGCECGCKDKKADSKAALAAPAAAPDPDGSHYWGAWPEGTNPVERGKMIPTNLISGAPNRNLPWTTNAGIGYQETCTAYGSMRFLNQIGDKDLLDKVVHRYDPVLTDSGGKVLITTPQHVDATVMGVLPLEIFILTASPEEKKAALATVSKLPIKNVPAAKDIYTGRPQPAPGMQAAAQTEWAAMNMSHQDQITKWLTIGKGHADSQWSNPNAEGLTDQTRYWVDDMFMVTSVQLQTYRATGDKIYLDRAARCAARRSW
jgi:unsaturated rhamnogalacturonyl hydrolase